MKRLRSVCKKVHWGEKHIAYAVVRKNNSIGVLNHNVWNEVRDKVDIRMNPIKYPLMWKIL